MKYSNYLTLIFFLVLPMMAMAQSQKEIKKNEIGTDITALLEQILNFNKAEDYYPYASTYQITYKRQFKGFSARLGIGGSTYSEDVDNNFSDEVIQRTNQLINYRIGIEKPIELSKRWNFYYGLDFRHSISNSKNEFHGQNGGWRYGSDIKNSLIGFSPLFGLEFRISKRIALQTEANYFVYFSKSTNQPIITQISENPSGEMPSTDLQKENRRGTEFSVPNFLVLTIRI